MPVTQFLPVEDAKRTIEKHVKKKQSIEELTTIEQPGKPVPAENFEIPRKRRTKSSPKSDRILTKEPKKEFTLIITEKPQAAMKIASALGNARQFSENNVQYYELSREGKKIIVASAVGHLFGLTYTKGQKGWPIFDLEWIPSHKTKSASFTKRYYDVLKNLTRRASDFIVATDYDIEGEVIGWNVLRFICNQKTARRMKYSTLTKDELERSYINSMPELDWGQAYAGETRHILDWLYGINLSRALMSAIKTTGSFRVLSIGRVQGPALKIIVDREKEISNFKPEPYWQVFAIVDGFPFKHPKDIFDKSSLEQFKNIKEGMAETKKSEEIIPPPSPFDLTTLQREAYRLHGLSPSQTLASAQKLYLSGLISYPRTSSQKIPSSIEPKKILKELEKNFPEAKIASRQKPVEGAKSDPAHPSIYPTGEFQPISGSEEKLYRLIAKRFISCFSPDAKTNNTRVVISAIPDEKIKFTASGLKIKEKGWTSVYPATLEESSVPELSGKVDIEKIKFEEKETTPPRRFTPASLVTLLEKKNLGTKATRSMIVDTLFDRGYLDGKSIKATPLGMKLIDSLEKYSPIIIDENLTRNIEEQMDEIQSLKENLKDKETEIVEKAKKIISDISEDFKAKEKEIGQEILSGLTDFRKEQAENNIIMPCPTCKKGNLRITFSKKTKRYFVSCSAYPECKQTYSLPPNALIKTTDKKTQDGLPILLAIRKGKRPWEFPFNVNWRAEQEKNKSDTNQN